MFKVRLSENRADQHKEDWVLSGRYLVGFVYNVLAVDHNKILVVDLGKRIHFKDVEPFEFVETGL
jgi:hypothetical protein